MRTLALASILALFAGCKGKPKHQAPPSAKVEHPGKTTGSGGPKAAPDIELPHGTGQPPVKTTAPLDEATLEKLAKMTFPGFQINVRGHAEHAINIRQLTEDHPKILATITITPCDGKCLPMDLDKWKADEALTKQFLPDVLKKAPDTVFEVGKINLNGQDMIDTYQLGQHFEANGGGTFSEAYVLYYNDGVNQARVVAEYKDDAMRTKEDMAKSVSKRDLHNVARAFMDVYTQAW